MSFPTQLGMYDNAGNYYSLSVSIGGQGLDINPASAPVPAPAPQAVDLVTSQIRLLDTIEWTKRFIANRESNIGNSVEPALTNANLILQTILGAPFKWRWNRVVIGFYTAKGQQDYYVFNWNPSTLAQVGWVTVDNYGNCQRCILAGVTGTTTPQWSNISGNSTNDGSVIWVNLGNLGGGTSINYDFGWIEGATVSDSRSTLHELNAKLWLASTSPQDRPREISAQLDYGDGNITFRLQPVPDGVYPVMITLQEKPGIFTRVKQTWAPIPDEYSRIYNWGLLSLMLLFADDPRFQVANQKFVTQLLGANTGLSETEKNAFLNNWMQITGQPVGLSTAQQQGFQARAT